MKRLSLVMAAAAACLGLASPANATQTITITGPSGNFGDDEVVCGADATAACEFTHTYDFLSPEGYQLVSSTFTSVATNAMTDISFDYVWLNGVEFDFLRTGVVEFATLLNQALIEGGNNTITVKGSIGAGGNGAYTGTLSFANNAVPEPGTWAMMLLGFGAVGFAMRRRAPKALTQIA
jgi:hypothetical protein